MKSLIIKASIVIAIVFFPLFATAQDDWGPATAIDNPAWWECEFPVLYGYQSPTVSSNDSLMFVNFMGFGEENFAYSIFYDNAWQCPVLLPSSIQNLGIYGPFLYDIGDTVVYFSSMQIEGGYGGIDLWAIRLNNGEWSAPWNLGPEINTSDHESSPSLTRDGSKLYFSRNTLIMSSEIINGQFTTPIVLPDVINDPNNGSSYPKISPDGLKLYFNLGGDGYRPSPMYVSNFVNGTWQEPVRLNGNINFSYPDPDCERIASESAEPSFTLNGTKVYFTHLEIVGWVCEPGTGIYVSELPTGIEDENPEKPSNISLAAYPNPFNAQTRIVYAGDLNQLRDIAIYSIIGQKVKSFAPAAEILWDGNDMQGNDASSGLYFVVANGINHKTVTKVTLLR